MEHALARRACLPLCNKVRAARRAHLRSGMLLHYEAQQRVLERGTVLGAVAEHGRQARRSCSELRCGRQPGDEPVDNCRVVHGDAGAARGAVLLRNCVTQEGGHLQAGHL